MMLVNVLLPVLVSATSLLYGVDSNCVYFGHGFCLGLTPGSKVEFLAGPDFVTHRVNIHDIGSLDIYEGTSPIYDKSKCQFRADRSFGQLLNWCSYKIEASSIFTFKKKEGIFTHYIVISVHESNEKLARNILDASLNFPNVSKPK